jgi:calcineurin-like phosphoesterase family protein
MSEVFFISDTHFGHKGILSFPSTKPFRPFDTVEEHDEELVKRWNETVAPKDIVWHMGDFCFGKRNIDIAGRLNGSKRLVMGNHDMYAIEDYLKHFDRVFGCAEYKGMILSHMPVHPSQFPRYYLNVHGHLHTNHILREDGSKDNRYFNVSCENTGLKPLPLDEVYNYWAENIG